MQRQSHSTTNGSPHEGAFSLFTKVTALKPVGSLSLPDLKKWIRHNEGPAGLPDLRVMTEAIRTHYGKYGKNSDYKRRKLELPAITPAGIFSPRNTSGLHQHSGYIPLDFDNLSSAEDKVTVLAQLKELSFVAFAALSVADGVWALAAVDPVPTTAQEHTAAWRAVVEAVQQQIVDVQIDQTGNDLPRARYVAADHNAHINYAAVPFHWSPIQRADSPKPLAIERSRPSPAEVESMLQVIDPDCDRNTWIKIGAALFRDGYDLDIWRDWSARGRKFNPNKDCTPEQWESLAHYEGREAHIGTVVWLAKKNGYERGLRRTPDPSMPAEEPKQSPASSDSVFRELRSIHSQLTELQHARRMLERHSSILLSVVEEDTRTLYVLQDNGIWLPGNDQIQRLYWETATYWLQMVVEHRNELSNFRDNDKAFADTVKALRATERNRACREGVKLTGSIVADWEKATEPPQAFYELTRAKKSQLDADLRYLGCENGVVDLHKGTLLPPEDARDKLVTRNTGVRYDPQASNAAVDKLTDHLSSEQRDWLFSALGYALRGYPDRTLYLLIGPPGGGKSTFLTAVRLALGEYVDALAEGALTQRNVNSATAGLSPEMEPFTRCRIVIDSDLESSAKLSTGRLKKLAGGDEVKWRALYSGFGDTRRVSATMFISLNPDQLPHLMIDSGLFERLRPLPYPAILEKQRDLGLRVELEQPEAREAMLALLVRYSMNTSRPPAIIEEVNQLRDQLRRESVGVGFYDWATTALLMTGNSGDRTSTSKLWEEACTAAGNDSPWGYNRRTFVPALRSLLDLPVARKMWIDGKVANGWKGLRLATREEVGTLPPGKTFSDWAAAYLFKTGNPDDRISTEILWELMVGAGGDPPWGYTRQQALAAIREFFALPPAKKIRFDGKVVNGWIGFTLRKWISPTLSAAPVGQPVKVVKAGVADPPRSPDFAPVAMHCLHCRATNQPWVVDFGGSRVCADEKACQERQHRQADPSVQGRSMLIQRDVRIVTGG